MAERHYALADFFHESPDIISAFESLTYRSEILEFNPDEWLDSVSKNEQVQVLQTLLWDPHLAQQTLLNQLRASYQEMGDSPETAPSISIKHINDLIDLTRKRREAAEQKFITQETKKITHKVTRLESSLWGRVNTLIEEKKSTHYKFAVQIMSAIKLASHHNHQEIRFIKRAAALRSSYPRRSSLHKLMDDYRLLEETCSLLDKDEAFTSFAQSTPSNASSHSSIDWQVFDF